MAPSRSLLLLALSLAALTTLGGPARGGAAQRLRAAPDVETARFAPCTRSSRIDCVVDGDTFWYHGRKIRVADINTPETGRPQCPAEAALGHRATARMQALLNQGAFTLAPNADGTGRDTDRYGRLLRVVSRGGASLGQVLVDEGLAEVWRGRRGTWC